MKKCRWLWAIIFCLALALGLTACGEGSNQPLTFQTLVFEDNRAQLTVSNGTESFSFADEIKAKWNTKFAVSSDEYGQNTFLTKVVPLAEGDNVFYVFAMNGDEITQTYTVTIRRRPMYTVSFEGFEWGEEQRVEEGSFATVPQEIPTKDFYTFDSWDFDFTQPITQSTTISATWNFAKEEVFVIEGTTLVGLTKKAEQLSEIPSEFFEELKGVTDIGEKAFYGCLKLKNIKIPDCITTIGNNAFTYCTKLTSITIPDSVTSMGKEVFDSCSRLAKAVIGNGTTFIPYSTFIYCYELTELTLPFVGASKGETTYTHLGYIFGALSHSSNKNFVPTSLKKVTITGGNSINHHAFYECSSVTSITLPDSVTTIGNEAFKSCTNLTNITIPDSIVSIGENLFDGCNNLNYNVKNQLNYLGNEKNPYAYLVRATSTEITEATIESGCKFIGDGAFVRCSSLTSIDIPDSVTSIGHSAFESCTNLTNVTIPDSIVSIGENLFDGCNNLNYNVKNQLNYLGNEKNPYAYLAGATSTEITTANIEEGCKFIGSNAFNDYQSLSSISIPNSVTFIGNSAFTNCYSLTFIIIPNSVTSIGRYAFFDCRNLTSITIPNDVTSIGEWTFYGCSNLTSVTIGNGVTAIEDFAFGDCTNLTHVYYHGTESEWESIAIDSGNNALNPATIYYYSESEPTASGNFWHYDENGVIAIW